MEDGADDLGAAVAGFRRAEAALAAIAADADRLVEARDEVEQARDELKVVSGALVGLATAHRDLVGQLGEAASALRPSERRDDDRLLVALRATEGAQARQVAEVAESVEELASRLDRALAERVGGVLASLSDTVAGLARADEVAAVRDRLGLLATTSDLEALEHRVVAGLGAASAPPPPDREMAELAATTAADAVEERVSRHLQEVQVGQQRVHQMVLAVGVAFLLFAALLSVLALR